MSEEPKFDYERSKRWIEGFKPKKIQLKKDGELIMDPIYLEYYGGSEPCFEQLNQEMLSLVAAIDEVKATDDKWRRHTTRTSLGKLALPKIREELKQSIISQAFVKFSEIANAFPELFPANMADSSFDTCHLCEAPGQFVYALDWFLSTFHPDNKWRWEASSLNPHSEFNEAKNMFLDDRFIVSFPHNWFFNENGKGNVFEYLNQKVEGFEFDLITGDGSIYCRQDSQMERENRVYELIWAEFNRILHFLKPGGSMVLKVYSWYYLRSSNLIMAMIRVFSNAWVFKPLSSNGRTSEKYIICTGYLGLQAGANNARVDDNELNLLANAHNFFCELQAYSLNFVLDTFDFTRDSENKVREWTERGVAAILQNIQLPSLSRVEKRTLSNLAYSTKFSTMVGDNYVEILNRMEERRRKGEDLIEYIKVKSHHDWPMRLELKGWGGMEFLPKICEFTERTYCEKNLNRTTKNLTHSIFVKPGDLFVLLPTRKIVDLFPFHDKTHKPNLKEICRFVEDENSLIVSVEDVVHSQIAIVILRMAFLHFDDLYSEQEDKERLKKCMNSVIIRTNRTSPVPMILSRFAASWIAIMLLAYEVIEFGRDDCLIKFSNRSPRIDDDSFVQKFLESLIPLDKMRSMKYTPANFVPTFSHEHFHDTFYAFNQGQIQKALDVIKRDKEEQNK